MADDPDKPADEPKFWKPTPGADGKYPTVRILPPNEGQLTFPEFVRRYATERPIDQQYVEEHTRRHAERIEALILGIAQSLDLPPMSPERDNFQPTMWNFRIPSDQRKRLEEDVRLATLSMDKQEQEIHQVMGLAAEYPYDYQIQRRLRGCQDNYDTLMTNVMEAKRKLAEYDQARKSH